MLDVRRDILPLKNPMYRLALRITLSSQEAEDVVQDVIIKLWNMRDRLDDVDNLGAFAMRMTRNLALDRQRMRANHTESLDVAMERPQAEDTRSDAQEQVETIRTMMQLLPEKQRSAMQLRDFEGYSYKEIAEMLAMTEDQVKVNIFRARQFIKTKLTSFN
ncbi:MAG: sigma-70 family RNA polymerase sigma factor [Prevotella sp.]|nr:sigma-70 family RNA polymerase sigma factor [Prevotella sp.]